MKRNTIIRAFILMTIDQIIKLVVELTKLDTIIIIKHFFNLVYVKNEGGAWGILSGKKIFFILISIFTFFLLLKYLKEETKLDLFLSITYSFILGGILGNLTDRLIRGYVVDYLSFNIFGYSFPVFNFADTLIVVGIFFLIIKTIGDDINEHKSRN